LLCFVFVFSTTNNKQQTTNNKQQNITTTKTSWCRTLWTCLSRSSQRSACRRARNTASPGGVKWEVDPDRAGSRSHQSGIWIPLLRDPPQF
jgi:hypothetical protein